MTVKPLVSVVTPSFNGADFLRDALNSILDQDYPSIELIVMDGGSTDGTVDILHSLGDRIQWRSEKDEGQSDALNKGFALAKGDLLTWLNSDDILYPGSITHSVNIFKAHPEAGLVYGRLDLLNRDGSYIRNDRNVREGTFSELLHQENFIAQTGALFSRTAWEVCGPLSVIDHYAMDWDLWIKIAARFPVIHTPRTFGGLRVYPETKTASGGLIRIEEVIRMLERNGSRAPYLYYKLGRWHYEHNQMSEARHALFESLRRGPTPSVRYRNISMILKSYLGGALVNIGRALRQWYQRRA